MVVRPITALAAAVLLGFLALGTALACFGPKLFVATGPGERNEALFALVTLYVVEKTGVESTRVDIEPGQDPLQLLKADKADLAFVETTEAAPDMIFQVNGELALVSGKRPLDELQFTTVLPAIRKLDKLLVREDVDELVRRIASGEAPLAAARRFLMERRWI